MPPANPDIPANSVNSATAALATAAPAVGHGWPDLRLRLFSALVTSLLFHRARLVHGERLPADGPVLYLGLHRNGAVDGYVYKSLLPRAVFMISVQLRRSLIGRLFFDGIEVSRAKDGGDADGNRDALERCVAQLQAGGALFIMPEGSSDLGHTHLPFHKGAARILAAALAQGICPTVVPLGIHYERAWAWQSDVEVVVGEAIDCAMPTDADLPRAVRLLHGRITAALEAVAIAAPDAATFVRWEQTAYASTLGTGRGYFSALKALEQGLPEADAAAHELATALADRRRLLRHQNVPLMPLRHAWAYAVYALILTPLVTAACLLNLPPLLVARWAGQRFADARNTIALWRLLTGLPALLLWAGGLLPVATVTGRPIWWLGYVLLSWLGLRSIYRWKKLAVSLGNLVLAPGLRQRLAAFHGRLDSIFRKLDL